ncbi:MAG: hypothetical protein ACRENX_02575 [Candidatus Dormibacteria bacterium]
MIDGEAVPARYGRGRTVSRVTAVRRPSPRRETGPDWLDTLESFIGFLGRPRADVLAAQVSIRFTDVEVIRRDDSGTHPTGEDAAEALYNLVDADPERRRVRLKRLTLPFSRGWSKGISSWRQCQNCRSPRDHRGVAVGPGVVGHHRLT